MLDIESQAFKIRTSPSSNLLSINEKAESGNRGMASLQSNKFTRISSQIDPLIPLAHYEGSFGQDLSGEVHDDELYLDGIGIDRRANQSNMERR